MDVRIGYSRIASLDGNWSWAPREVISDVVGAVVLTDMGRGRKEYVLREDADHYVLEYLAERYQPIERLDDAERIEALEWLARNLRWQLSFAEAGRFPPGLSEAVEELIYGVDGTITVPSLEALLYLSFTELLRKGPISFPQCDNCDFPFIPTGRGERFCSRPALNRKTPCRILAAMERHQARAPGFLNERKRIYEMVRRHPEELNDFTGWKLENTRESWVKFEDWKATRKEGHDGKT